MCLLVSGVVAWLTRRARGLPTSNMFKGGGIGALFGGKKPDDGGGAPSPGGGRGPRVAGIGALLGSPDTRRGSATPTGGARRAAPAPEIADGDMPALFARAQELLDKTNRRAELGSRTVRRHPSHRRPRVPNDGRRRILEFRSLDATRRPAPRPRPTDLPFPPPRPRRAARRRQPTVHARQRNQTPGRSPSRGDPESHRRGRTRRVDRATRLPRRRRRLGGGARDGRRGTRRGTRTVAGFAEPHSPRRARGRHVRGPRRVPRERDPEPFAPGLGVSDGPLQRVGPHPFHADGLSSDRRRGGYRRRAPTADVIHPVRRRGPRRARRVHVRVFRSGV